MLVLSYSLANDSKLPVVYRYFINIYCCAFFNPLLVFDVVSTTSLQILQILSNKVFGFPIITQVYYEQNIVQDFQV